MLADRVVVVAKVGERLGHRVGIRRCVAGHAFGDVTNAGRPVGQDVVRVISILTGPAPAERQRLEDDIRSRPTDGDRTRGSVAGERGPVEVNELALIEREREPWGDDRPKVGLEMLDRATPLLVFDRRDQEVDRHVEVLRRPALDDGAALIGLVVSEPGLAQASAISL
jgi:hypothetical protein